MAGNTFLGSGMKFPPDIHKNTGRFMVSGEEESVKESVYIILMTQKTERWVRPDFGSRLLSYTFMDAGSTRIHMMARDLENTILSQEPRISRVDVSIDPDIKKGCLMVSIQYLIQEKNVLDNLVFPFYLEAVPEGEHVL